MIKDKMASGRLKECVFGLTLQIRDIIIVVTVHVCAGRYLRSKESAKIKHQE